MGGQRRPIHTLTLPDVAPWVQFYLTVSTARRLLQKAALQYPGPQPQWAFVPLLICLPGVCFSFFSAPHLPLSKLKLRKVCFQEKGAQVPAASSDCRDEGQREPGRAGRRVGDGMGVGLHPGLSVS